METWYIYVYLLSTVTAHLRAISCTDARFRRRRNQMVLRVYTFDMYVYTRE